MPSAYFWIDILTLVAPLALSFNKKVAFAGKWRLILPAILIPATLYLIWDFIFTRLAVWSFNKEYISGYYILNLPLEEILFFLCVPYTCLLIYEYLRCYAPGEGSKAFAVIFGWLLVSICAIALILYYNRIYTAVTALLLMVTLINHLTATRGNYLSHIFMAWGLALVPLSVISGFLTALPIVSYDDALHSGIHIGSIPIENFFYYLLFMIWMVWVFEYFRQKPALKAASDKL